jgi:hypothetical protein
MVVRPDPLSHCLVVHVAGKELPGGCHHDPWIVRVVDDRHLADLLDERITRVEGFDAVGTMEIRKPSAVGRAPRPGQGARSDAVATSSGLEWLGVVIAAAPFAVDVPAGLARNGSDRTPTRQDILKQIFKDLFT